MVLPAELIEPGQTNTTMAMANSARFILITKPTSRRLAILRLANKVTTNDTNIATTPNTVATQPATPSQSDMNAPVSVKTSPTMLRKAA